MATDLESNTADRTEVSCPDLSRSRGRTLEVLNVLTVPHYFHFFNIKNKLSGGLFAIDNLAAQLNLERFDSMRLTGP